LSILSAIGGIVSGIVKPVGDIIDNVNTSDEERLKLRNALAEIESKITLTLINAQRDVVTAEAQSQSWLARNWRPITMISFVGIIVNNYMIVPYVKAFGGFVPTLDIPPNMWTLLTAGMTGYILGRSGEKIAKVMNGAKK